MELPSMVGQSFHLGLESLEPCGACWITLCGFLCSGCSGAGFGGRTLHHQNGLGRWWRSSVPNGTIPHGWSTISTWVWSHWNHMVPVGGTLCVSVQWCSWGWIWV
jgi:hypothetical protein